MKFSPVVHGILAMGICILSILSAPPAGQARSCLELSSQNDPISMKVGAALEHLFADQNPCFVVIYNPPARSAQLLLDDEVDGEFLRLADFAPYQQADVVMVPVPLVSGEGILVSRDPKITSFESLGQSALGYRRGTDWSDNLSKFYPNRIAVPSYELMVEMFNKGRIDALLIDDLNLRGYGYMLSGTTRTPLKETSAYVWLAAKHKDLITQITAVLQKFYAEGHSFIGS
ncbi:MULTISPECIES: substrate-binding periplasmic protein [Thalassospira]|nr:MULTISPECIES: transporter substrate-binding domain-containing protein [Thalassospira]MDG4718262.1 transporter substrate-binding domain-containing protein [Thalassospira sp. FZY0004]